MQFTISAAVFGLAALVAAAPAAVPVAVVVRGDSYGGGNPYQGGNQWGGQGGQGGNQWGGQGGQVYCPKGQQHGCYTDEPQHHGSAYNDVDVYSSCSGNQQKGLIPVSLCDNLNGNTILPINLELLNF